MILSDTAIRNRVSVMVLALILIVFGIYCYRVLPREAAPDITIPFVFVSTAYKGVSSADIETSITMPLEKKLKGLEGLKRLHSVSSEGLSQINIEFVPGTDIDVVLRKVKDKVDEASGDLPTDLENDPAVFEVNFSEWPIVVYSLSGAAGIAALSDIAEGLQDDIEGLPGVLEVEVTGKREREIRIEVDPDKLAYYRIPITVLQAVVSAENRNTSGGDIYLGDGRYQLRVPGEFNTPDEVYGLVIASPDGRPIYLKDVARVVDGFVEESSRSRLNGRDAINITVKKRSGENIISIVQSIDRLISKKQAAWPQGTVITKLMDQSRDIRLMVEDLENNIVSGLLLVVLVLFFFMGFRNALLVAIAIPFSMFLSFMVLYAMGITLNMVVLFALTLALGMLVDNAVVIVENIYRFMEQGVPRITAAMKATSEVAYPVIGSTLTTLAAFFALIFWPGIMGEFMKYLPMTLIVTLSSSLFVALVINPAMAAYFMKIRPGARRPYATNTETGSDRSMERPVVIRGVILTVYARLLGIALRHRFAVLLIAFISLILMIQIWLLAVGLEKPVELFPHIDPKGIYLNLKPPEGAGLEYIDDIVRRIEIAAAGHPQGSAAPNRRVSETVYREAYADKIHRTPGGREYAGPSDLANIEYMYARSQKTGGGGDLFDTSRLPNHIGVQFIDLTDRTRSTLDTMDDIRRRIVDIAGGRITIDERQEGPPTGAPINIEVSGDDFRVLGRLASEIRGLLSRIPFIKDLQDDYVDAIPSIRVTIDRQKAAILGLSTGDIGFALKTAYNGLEISTFQEGGEDYDIIVKLTDEDRQGMDVLRKIMIPSPSGQLVPLTTLAAIEYTGGLGNIVRVNNERVVTVSGNVDTAIAPGPVARMKAEELMEQFPMPHGYRYVFTGENEEQRNAEAFLSKAFVIGVFLIFLILVTLFNSVVQPLIILSSVILSLGGVFLALTLIRSPFGIIMTGVGIISLAGVVVNNAIILIDYTNKLRISGMEITGAIVSAGATRLRPVFLTAVTTILGLIPMITGVSWDFHKMELMLVSESTQWWRNMASVVACGLLMATILTLFVVPTLYSLIESLKAKAAGWKGRESGIPS